MELITLGIDTDHVLTRPATHLSDAPLCPTRKQAPEALRRTILAAGTTSDPPATARLPVPGGSN